MSGSIALPAMMLAAGFGTRMRPLTETRPKPLIEVGGRPLIAHTQGLLEAAGVTRIVCNAHYLSAQIEAYFSGSDVTVLTETPDILDTGGGLRNALPYLGSGPVITANPDVIWRGPNPVEMVLDAWDPARMDALLVCAAPERAIGTASKGDFTIAEDGSLTRGPGAIYASIQITKTDLLHEVPEPAFSLNRIWDVMIARGRCFGLLYPGYWCDVGHPGGIAEAEALLSEAPS